MATFAERTKLLRGVLDGERAYRGPFYVNLGLTRRCNLKCLGCQFHSSERKGLSPGAGQATDMALELAQRLAQELPRLGTREVIVSGEGEPMLHTHWFEIVRCFKDAGCKVQFITNGTLLNERNANLVMDSGLEHLRVSLWTVLPAEYVKLYPGIDVKNMQRTMEGIRRVVELKREHRTAHPRVTLRGNLNRYNYRSLAKIIRAGRDLGCDEVVLTRYKTRGGEFSHVAMTDEQEAALRRELAQLQPLLQPLPPSCRIEVHPARKEGMPASLPCYVGWFNARIRFDGAVMPCAECYVFMGQLQDSSFASIWNGGEYRAFRRWSQTRTGLDSLARWCDCNSCCDVRDNLRVHRLFRWVAPLARRR